MDADIEHLVLSGKLFGTDAMGPPSPPRTPSPSLSFEEYVDDEKDGRRDEVRPAHYESIGMGPGRTGVKGVIRDQHEAQTMQAAKREREMEALRKRMERGNLGGKTFLEEEEEEEERVLGGGDDDLGRLLRRGRDVLGRAKEGSFGHLREVGRAGFVSAVEREERGVWVVVHLYESSLDRCYTLDDTLSRLARLYPRTKFLRARAAALGFASTGQSSRLGRSRRQGVPGRYVQDDDDPYDDGGGEEEKERTPYYDEEEDEEEDVDTDMLPTMLVYRDGELVHNWVRVDWEAGRAGVEELLSRRHIITEEPGKGNCGLPSDEEDVVWSDEEAAS